MLDEDLTIFFDDFAVSATLVNQGRTISVITNAPDEYLLLAGIGNDVERPLMLAIDADVVDVVDGDPIQIGGIDYLVISNRAEGTGLAWLSYKRAPTETIENVDQWRSVEST